MATIRQFVSLATLTAIEAIRQPICLLLTTACVLVTAITPLLIMHNFGEGGRLARDGGLAFHFVFGVFVAGYAASSSVSREMRTGTASAVLSKPVGRETFLLAKLVGIVVVILAFSLCAACATLLSERVAEKFVQSPDFSGYVTDRLTGALLLAAPAVAYLLAGLINYFLRRPFESTAFGLLMVCLLVTFLAVGCFDRLGHFAPLDFRVQWRIVPANILIAMALLVLGAIAVALSTRLQTVPTLTICTTIFLLGLVSDFLFGRRAAESAVAGLLHGIIPNWQHFWMSDALANGGSIPAVYVLNAGLYALAYTAAALCIGLASFRHAEMK